MSSSNGSPYSAGSLERVQARPGTVGEMFLAQVAASGPREAYRYPEGDRWVSLSWDQAKDYAFKLAAGLISLGLEPEDRVGIASGTRIEWVLADLAVVCAAGATTTVYPNTQAAEVAFILSDSGSKMIFTEDDGQTRKILDQLDALPEVTKIIQIDGRIEHDRVIGWQQLLAQGAELLAERPDVVDVAMAKVGPESLATLIYTSGTTGKPKGVRLVHDSWTYEGAAMNELGFAGSDDLQYLWLPLAHSFGKLLSVVQFKIGFTTAVDGRIDKIVDGLGQVRPTFMAGAPRIFEKVRATIMLQANSGLKAKIFGWAFGVGRRTAPVRLAGKQPTGLLKLQAKLADRLVFSKIKERMGGRIRFFVSGSAGLADEVQEWFYDAGMLVIEGYGMTETSAATFVDDPRNPHFGTVGPPAVGTEVKIAEDGEIMISGPGVMRGYHKLPDATAETLVDGWLMTGDIGHVDDSGCLVITDRKKDLIKTSGGKYVAPQKVEGAVKAVCPYVSQVVVHGEHRKYISALITLDPDALKRWAGENDLADTPLDELSRLPQVRTLIEGYVERANGQLARWETIKRFEILPAELSVEDGEVTPSLKVKRRAVETRYAELLDSLYDD
ncbi:AMP-dependent synthetase/ligase [Microlunatus soli]|uniref:Acyl-CoA synthetase n=1 Tax=Microlunatus soli TaxID=630515 RepID=A0A1H1Y1U3_9ACTN|nr:long-chain fatty acid--CoA ligase [Microlunatus soli]SDT15448.1 long-chain acyl-CoA synthetase [Microlunatus soli]